MERTAASIRAAADGARRGDGPRSQRLDDGDPRGQRPSSNAVPVAMEATQAPAPAGRTRDAQPPDLLPLLVWLSPSFPIGAFAYSHGVEWAVEAGDVRDLASLDAWVADLVEHGGPWSDAVLLACAHRAARDSVTCATSDDPCRSGNASDPSEKTDASAASERLAEIGALALALAPSRERRLETSQQGGSFLSAVRTAWPHEALERHARTLGTRVALPVAVGVAAAAHDLPRLATVEAYVLSLVGNLVSAAVRLVPLGQTDGTLAVAHATPLIRATAARAAVATLDDVGGCALRSDVASMRHETQTTRLFRS